MNFDYFIIVDILIILIIFVFFIILCHTVNIIVLFIKVKKNIISKEFC